MPEEGGQAVNDPAPLLMDMNMMDITSGGRERTRSEFAALFTKAGLQLTEVQPSMPGTSSLIYGRKADRNNA